MSTTVRVNGTVQFTFFLVMTLNITIVTSCDSHMTAVINTHIPQKFFLRPVSQTTVTANITMSRTVATRRITQKV